MLHTLLIALLVAAAAYQLLALTACLRQSKKREPIARELPPISILKPVRGADAAFYQALLSHAEQDYPEFEILLGVSDPEDTAIPFIQRLIAEFPERSIQLIQCNPQTPNKKVGALMELNARARYPIRVVNDGDIGVPAGYLRDVTAPLVNGTAGLVTCVYRARADSFAGRMEALGIVTDFAPSALVAPMMGVNEFGMGSTQAFQANTLEEIGGFATIADYIADDYQLGKRISESGRRVLLSSVVVETHLHAQTWGDVWRHQLRWARTIRASRPGGYAGIPITNASLWAIVAACAGLWWWAAALLTLRKITASVAVAVLRADDARRLLWLVPLRDLFGFVVWLAGLGGNTVDWGGVRLRLDRQGRIR